jgi:hypothetical protein
MGEALVVVVRLSFDDNGFESGIGEISTSSISPTGYIA